MAAPLGFAPDDEFSEWQLECVEFIDCWMGLAGTPCVTLVSISPANGATAARTFDGPGAVEWVAEQQDLGRNVYFEVNETGIIAAYARAYAAINPPSPWRRRRVFENC